MLRFDPNSPWPRRIRNLLIAIAVIVALEAILGHFSKGWIARGGGENVYRTRFKIKGIAAGLVSYHFMKGAYPANFEALKLLLDPPPDDKKFHLPHLTKEPRTADAWKREFRYVCPGVHNTDSYDLWSVGADGIDGTEDDVTNWQSESSSSASEAP